MLLFDAIDLSLNHSSSVESSGAKLERSLAGGIFRESRPLEEEIDCFLSDNFLGNFDTLHRDVEVAQSLNAVFDAVNHFDRAELIFQRAFELVV